MTGPWQMPAETHPHDATWMAWPSGSYALGDTLAKADEARRTWSSVANTIADFEPVHVVVPPSERTAARQWLSASIEVHEAPLDDAWYRDIGPTFVLGPDGLGAVNWVFNGWGGQDWATWEHDAVASDVATTATGAVRIDSPMVNEGGGIHTDGHGTFLVTESVQLDPGRNPGWTRADVEAELARTVGAQRVIWVPRGLTRDNERYGTRGHIDIVAAMPESGVVLVHDQRDAAHPDAVISAEVRAILTDAGLDVIALPAPKTLTDEAGWVDYSYVNHYVCNGAVIACAFDDPVDDEARGILAEAYPGREVIGLDARPLYARGGGIHCITQQQPTVTKDPS